MTDGTTPFTEPDAPVGYPVEIDPAEQVRPDFVGIEEHGAPALDIISAADQGVIRSAVWGNRTVPINTQHNEFASWDPCQGGVVPCRTSCATGCCWYNFATEVCCDFCSHPGMDIGVNKHTALYAAQAGRVEFAGRDGFYKPFHVDVRTPGGDLHIYGHMWSIDEEVIRGGLVSEGQYLGTSGEQTSGTGMEPDGSGPHLHFELRQGRCAIDPTPMLEQATVVKHCSPSPPPPFDGTPQTIGNVVFQPDQRTVEVAFNGLGSRRWANIQACPTREPLAQGETIDVLYWVVGERIVGEDRWWITTNGSRVHVAGTVQKPGQP